MVRAKLKASVTGSVEGDAVSALPPIVLVVAAVRKGVNVYAFCVAGVHDRVHNAALASAVKLIAEKQHF
jgi:hypothetical protein